jgi:uncharacterized protein YuzE
MRLTKEPAANVAAIRLRERQGEDATVEFAANFLPDIDTTGAVRGIELLHAEAHLCRMRRRQAHAGEGN